MAATSLWRQMHKVLKNDSLSKGKGKKLGGSGKCIWLLCFLHNSHGGRFAGVETSPNFHTKRRRIFQIPGHSFEMRKGDTPRQVESVLGAKCDGHNSCSAPSSQSSSSSARHHQLWSSVIPLGNVIISAVVNCLLDAPGKLTSNKVMWTLGNGWRPSVFGKREPFHP